MRPQPLKGKFGPRPHRGRRLRREFGYSFLKSSFESSTKLIATTTAEPISPRKNIASATRIAIETNPMIEILACLGAAEKAPVWRVLVQECQVLSFELQSVSTEHILHLGPRATHTCRPW